MVVSPIERLKASLAGFEVVLGAVVGQVVATLERSDERTLTVSVQDLRRPLLEMEVVVVWGEPGDAAPAAGFDGFDVVGGRLWVRYRVTKDGQADISYSPMDMHIMRNLSDHAWEWFYRVVNEEEQPANDEVIIEGGPRTRAGR